MRHIALLIPTLDQIGGAERQVMLLAKEFVRRNWRVTVIALSGTGGDAADEVIAAGVSFHSLEMRKGLADPRGWLRFRRWLRHELPDVVHAHLPHAAWLARWSRLATPMRVLIDSIHSSGTGRIGRKLGYRVSAGMTDEITAVSPAAADAWLSAGLVVRQTIKIIPNGIDFEVWKPDPDIRRKVRDELRLTDEFLWLAAGRLETVKDYPTLLRAMAAIPYRSCLVVAGAGKLADELAQYAIELDLGKRVRFLGFVPNVLRWMQAADGFVLSSRWEGLPMAVMEACACARPIVATAVPGTLAILVDDDTGLLAEAGSVSSLAKRMTELMAMPMEARAAMADRARRSVVERFSIESVSNRWESLYESVLERNPEPLALGSR